MVRYILNQRAYSLLAYHRRKEIVNSGCRRWEETCIYLNIYPIPTFPGAVGCAWHRRSQSSVRQPDAGRLGTPRPLPRLRRSSWVSGCCGLGMGGGGQTPVRRKAAAPLCRRRCTQHPGHKLLPAAPCTSSRIVGYI